MTCKAKRGSIHCRRPGSKRRKHGLGDDGEPAHIGKLFIARDVQVNGRRVKRFSGVAAKELAQNVANFFGGGATTISATGLYQEPGAKRVQERSVTVEIVSSGADSCKLFHDRLSRAAAFAAKTFNQSAVLAETHCADGGTRAGFVDRDNAQAFPLPRLKD
jgi:hypothetical protein